MDKDITPLMENFEKALSSLASKLEEAKSNALSAYTAADRAKDEADEAHEYADNADDRLNEAKDLHGTCYRILQELRAKLEDPDRLESTGMAADIALHRVKVLKLRNSGHSPKVIADHLNITEFLVNQILTAESRAA